MQSYPKISIRHVPNIEGSTTPARCNRRTGEILINDSRWPKIEPTHRLFILLHEYAHVVLNSSDEFEVDQLAHKMFVEMGYPLTESVKALSRVLTGTSESHVERVKAQADRAYEFDKKNQKTKNCMCNGKPFCPKCNQNKTGTILDQANTDIFSNFIGFTNTDEYTEDLFGLGKKAQERRKTKLQLKYSVKQAKADGMKALKEGRGAGLEAKGLAKKSLADQGISGGGEIAGALKEGIGAIAEASNAKEATPQPKSKVALYVMITIGSLMIIGGIVYMVVKSKAKKTA